MVFIRIYQKILIFDLTKDFFLPEKVNVWRYQLFARICMPAAGIMRKRVLQHGKGQGYEIAQLYAICWLCGIYI